MTMFRIAAAATGFAFAFAAAPAWADSLSQSGAGFTITDGTTASPAVQTSIITVATPGVFTGATVSLNSLTHSYVGDLIARLSHGGVTIDLFNRPGTTEFDTINAGNSMNFGGTYLFSGSATQSLPEVSTGSANVIAPGSYLPEQSFAAFNGQSIAGAWTLTIADADASDTGTLGSWTLNLDYRAATAAVPEPGSWGLMILGFGAMGAAMRRRATMRTRVRFG